MEEGGFTVVLPNSKSATDGVNSMPVGIGKTKEIKLDPKYMNKRKAKESRKNDFYKF